MNPSTQIPIPADIPLPLPAHPDFLKLAIIFLFLLHILFVNLMLGGTLLALVYEWMGLRKKDYDRLAREIVSTITVNKSLAVVLGVGPLLTINVLYTVYFYSANALTGIAWFMVIPLVSVAFLLGYAYKYTWDVLADQKGLHMAIGAGAAMLFLIIPLIFLSNINLMLFPARWLEVSGWLSTLFLPNVFPRYIHFLFACIAISGLFYAGYFGRANYPVETLFEGLTRKDIRRMFYGIAFAATVANFFAGPLLFITLPVEGVSWSLAGIIACGVGLALIVAGILWRDIISAKDPAAGRYYIMIALLTGTVVFMGTGRHLYRENALAVHQIKMEENTLIYQSKVQIAEWRKSQGLEMPQEQSGMTPGERVFRNICATCHAYNTRLVGPPLTEIATIYPNDIAGITKWVKNPGKKRPDYQQMPAINLTESQYQAVAQYILDLVAGGGKLESTPESPNPTPTPKPE